ncbi:biotin/lipoyl-containing protein [Thiomicrorhabdus aquaedulcis]|uniref:biotin/lipoyl-containing protein n=1 Tax=Thiomicrorhabdus aquaedulcis TaxID=2211106 RepID=UPI003B83489F
MATIQFSIPDIGDFDTVEVIEVLVKNGDTVKMDDSLMTLESDKATMEIPCPVNGVISNLKIVLGDKVKQGTYVCDIEVNDAAQTTQTTPQVSAPVAAVTATAAPVAPVAAVQAAAPSAPAVLPGLVNDSKPINKQSMGAQFHASPSVRIFARTLGTDLTHVKGSGPKGRIQKMTLKPLLNRLCKVR